MAKASNGTSFVEHRELCRNGLHGHELELKANRRNACKLAFPCFSHIKHHGRAQIRHLLKPFIELRWTKLLHLKSKSVVFGKAMQSGRYCVPSLGSLPLLCTRASDDSGPHDGLFAHNG